MKKTITQLNFIFYAFCLSITNLNSQVVSTYAGTGISGSTDGPILSATFTNPHGMYINSTGDIYIAEQGTHKIRKITSAGVVSTFAGSGTSGSTNGTGTAASFNGPRGICADASGNIYVADCFNHKIRKITPAGVVTNFAGSGTPGSSNGTGTAASFNGPRGICADASGNIYVADEANHKIRKITPAGVVTTFAGIATSGSADGPATTASFYNPRGICIDGPGNIYVADTYNNSIRKISPAGLVSTLAGSGAFAVSDGIGTAASFASPNTVYANNSGDLYVGDYHSIRKVTSTGVVTTIAGSGTAGSADGTGTAASFNIPTGLCLDASDNIYIADFGNRKIRKISACIEPLAPTNTTSSSNQTLCENNTTVLSAASTGTINWYATPSGTTILSSGTNYTTSVLSAGTYTYYAAALTCTTSTSRTEITVTVNAIPTVSVNSGSICSGSSFTINPGGASTYTISGGNNVVTPTADASYSVTGTSTEGCVSSNTAISSVTVNALPTLSVTSSNSIICTGESATLTAAGADTYTWSTSDQTNAISVSPTVTTTYTLSGTDGNGCENTSTITQSVSLCTGIATVTKEGPISIYPNPFNTVFTISGIELNTSIIIYNTLGELVKTVQPVNTDASIDLSGYLNGIYIIKVQNSKGESIQKLIKQ